MTQTHQNLILIISISVFLIVTGCRSPQKQTPSKIRWDSVQDTTNRIATIDGGLQGPESVQYDAEQDVYFISNFNGGGMEADSNGFISRAQPDGTIDSLKFMTGTEQYPFHAGHGMYLVGVTLFVASRDGVHGFDKNTGKHLSFADFSKFDHGFINDIAMGSDSALYVTDSSDNILYRVQGQNVTVATDSLPSPANGIIDDKDNGLLVLAPWGEGNNTYMTWDPKNNTQGKIGNGTSTLYDGIEFLGNNLILSSQADSTLRVFRDGRENIFVKVAGAPADIGLDTKRRQVAVPYVALNRVDIWQLPEK